MILAIVGRLHDEELMAELQRIKAEVKPDDIAGTGRYDRPGCGQCGQVFDDTLGIDGTILTTNWTARYPAAVRRCPSGRTGKPIKFVGMKSWKIWSRFSRIGWPLAFRAWAMWRPWIDKAQEQFDKQAAKRHSKENKFDLNDLLDQMHQLKKWGSGRSCPCCRAKRVQG